MLNRYELGSEEDDMDAVRRKATALSPRFHVMLVRCRAQGTVMCAIAPVVALLVRCWGQGTAAWESRRQRRAATQLPP